MPDMARPGLNAGDEVGEVGELLRLLFEGRPSWHADGLCHEYPEVSWFPERGRGARTPKAICRRCLVVEQCATWALAQDSKLQGVWGGLSEHDRRQMRRHEAA